MTSLHLADHVSTPSAEAMYDGAHWWLRSLVA
jgi:hypothetical protein